MIIVLCIYAVFFNCFLILRRNSVLTKDVHDAIASFQNAKIRESSGSKRQRESSQHESLKQILHRIEAFAVDEADHDFQFAGMNIEEGSDQVDDNTMRMDTDDI